MDSEESGIAQILCDNLLVEPLPIEYLSRWRITLLGMRSLKSHMPLGEFRLLFQPRVSAPVAERTVFELMLDLKTVGWNLAKRYPPSSKKRRKKMLLHTYLVGQRHGIVVFRQIGLIYRCWFRPITFLKRV